MTTQLPACGRIERRAGVQVGHLARELGHDAASVWRLLTDPARLLQWLASGRIELRLGGAVHIDFVDSGTVIDSRVTAFEDGRLLEYSWSHAGEPARPLRWTLSPTAAGTRLELEVTIPEGEDAAKACAGFEGHLEMLAAALEGVPIKFPFDVFVAARKNYQAQLADH